ncbi:MAG: PmeII family type II restriction endonuclease [Chitinophagales bacterium]
MKQELRIEQLNEYVEEHIDAFHTKRLEKLQKLNLKKILKRKKPYLFKAKHILKSQDLIESLLDAFLQSQEETLFGNFLEEVAIFVCGNIFGGIKTQNLEGIDLLFFKNEILYIVEIKSGPNWGNSSQLKKLKDNFRKAKAILSKKYPNTTIIAVNGCCYGKERKTDKGEYFKYCGQEFWEFISDNPNLYTDIIDPLGYKAKEKNEAFDKAYVRVINKFTFEFMKDFCNNSGDINWKGLVAFNSEKSI